ncbi:MAG: glycosyltransferase family 9 protein [Deltaproteobacteria bacterium]|nr:glycosyltransferase family 9 protein [Deltaproteobacteria bacterium]
MTPRHVLVIQLARLGDLVQTWPLLRQLRRAYPGAQLSLLSDEKLHDLAGFGPEIDGLSGLDLEKAAQLAPGRAGEAYNILSRAVENLKSRKFDIVYNLNFSRLSLLIAYLLGVPVVGCRPAAGGREVWREPWLAYVYGLVHARVFNRIHLSDMFRHLAPPATVPETTPPPAASREPLIAMQTATRHPKRTWPLTFYAELAGRLIETLGARIWLTGTAEERGLGESLIRSLPPSWRERVTNLQGITTLSELTERLKQADLLISGDTGTLHLAAAMGTKVVGIFLGPASCFETGPYGPEQWVVQAEPPCHPCAEAGPGCPEPVCRTMIPPKLAAEVASAACGQGEFPDEKYPGVRVYRTAMESFGVRYEVRAGRHLVWADLVGQAYRVAGAQVLGGGLQPLPLQAASLSLADRRNLQRLAGALRNGAVAVAPAVRQALVPLWAFEKTLASQTAWKEMEPPVQVVMQKVKKVLREELEKFV